MNSQGDGGVDERATRRRRSVGALKKGFSAR